MTTLTTVSAVTFIGDGQRQIFPFETDDGTAVPHESPSEVVVTVNGAELKDRQDYTITHDSGRSVVTFLRAPVLGGDIEIARHTELVQPKKFRRSGDWDITAVEASLDRVTRGVLDALWRISKLEKIVHVEHRVVEVPAEFTPAIADVQGLAEQLAELRESSAQQAPENMDDLASAIAQVVLNEVNRMQENQAKYMSDLASRVARLEDQMTAIYHGVS